MKAMLYHDPGGPEVLRYVDVPDPEPGAGDVVVRVDACALNRLDLVQRNGWFQMPGFQYPHIAGMDVAGIIDSVGEAVTNVSVGDRVVVDPSLAGVADNSSLAGRGDLFGDPGTIGGTVDGGYAELCLAPASHAPMFPHNGRRVGHNPCGRVGLVRRRDPAGEECWSDGVRHGRYRREV